MPDATSKSAFGTPVTMAEMAGHDRRNTQKTVFLPSLDLFRGPGSFEGVIREPCAFAALAVAA
jgi:hypothetical protein